MDLPPAWSQTCVCGRAFSVPQAYTFHQRSCQRTKKRLLGALEKVKDILQVRKRRKVESVFLAPNLAAKAGSSSQPVDLAHPNDLFPVVHSEVQFLFNQAQNLAAEAGPSSQPMDLAHPNDLLIPVVHSEGAMAIAKDYEDLDCSLAQRRGRREHRQLPKRYRDVLPEPPAALPPASALTAAQIGTVTSPPIIAEPALPQALSESPVLSPVRNILKSACNGFGLFRQYHATSFPDHDPNENMDDLIDSSPDTHLVETYHPYPNHSSFLLGEWYWNDGVQKSQSNFQNLLKIVGHPEFRPEDVAGLNWQSIDAQLSGDRRVESLDDEGSWQDEGVDGDWVETPIKIKVPFHKRMLHPGEKAFDAGNLHHRKLVSVIREKITRSSTHPHLHFEPYGLYWQPKESFEPVRVHGELYTSEAFIEAHHDLQRATREPGCDLARVVVGLMFASDGTQLANFSNAKLSPIYLGIGNESKDRRSKPSCQAFEHIAYFETLPDAFKSFAKKFIGGKGPDSVFMAHCHREMYHAQWAIILDDEFLEAYQHGIVIGCLDGIERRFYPRIFTYSADYPEKVIIASIRNLGRCPCPRCLIPLDRAANMGMQRDMTQRMNLVRIDDANRRDRVKAARDHIYEKSNGINSKGVGNLLQESSLVPTTNAFSDKLSPFGFNLFSMLVVDLMHEVELGVWKATFIHLLRIIDCLNKTHDLDQRFREIPPFGIDGIRKITSNRSELKKMTAHDYEDMLLCAIPVFDGLLDEPHNTCVLKLLFDLAHWHGLAKLRMHTDPTLEILSRVTTSLGNSFRIFVGKTCAAFQTRELERERVARQRREEKTAVQKPSKSSRKPKQLNLKTYKYHSLGDYVETIRRFGTTDSYSTQSTELEHRTSKSRYLRTSRRSIPQQLSRIERRQRRINMIRERLHRSPVSEPLINDPRMQYNIGQSQRCSVHIPTFLQKNESDPAIKNFFSKLREHLLPRVRAALRQEAELRPDQSSIRTINSSHHFDGNGRDFVLLDKDLIYHHKLIRFHFTTYDVRRGTDIINPGTSRCNVMFLADQVDGTTDSSNLHHFLYARVLGAYHANVIYTGPGMCDYEPHRFDFLWVRWFEVVNPASSGWEASKLDSVRFPPLREEASFGFVDPKDVLRGCHIIPAFAKGRRHRNGVGVSRCAKDGNDYTLYYVGRFSAPDLMMRYHWGLGVGHYHAHQPTSSLRHDSTSQPITNEPGDIQDNPSSNLEPEGTSYRNADALEDDNLEYISDDPELGLEDEGWQDTDTNGTSDGGQSGSDYEDIEEEDYTGW